ncbi:MAG: hypothetical protein IIC61_08710 [Proteobacteria bacterium]|nr:hypothetical protein [Pseudomonadota bacterium]
MMNSSMRTLVMILWLLCLSLGAAPLYAQEDDSAALVAIIDAIEKGWEHGDGQPFREHYLDFDGARYIESGG